MVRFLRRQVLKILQWLRRSSFRQPLLRFWVWMHNTAYHQISFFASHEGLHPKHRIINYHKFFLDNVSEDDAILDVGSGNGAVAYDVASKAKRVVGVDIRPVNVEKSKNAYQRDNLEFLEADATSHNFNESFDAIVLSNVLEHIEHRPEFLSKLAKVAPRILIRVPMITRDWVTVYKQEQGLEYRLDDTHYIEYSEPVFREEVKQAGLKVDHLHTIFGELYAVVTR